MSALDLRVAHLSGYAPALPTPFKDDGNIDGAAFERLCDHQIGEGAAALAVCGTTGEAPTLTAREQGTLIHIACRAARGRVPVIAGAGSNSTAHALELTRDAEAAGADGILSIVPYYNKPTQAGLYAHFRAIAQSTGLPIILYDVPSRTACGLADDTIARLAEIPGIAGLKDASGDASRPVRLRPLVGHDFRLLSGDDTTALAFLSQGGNGCISVTSNIAPGLCWTMFLEQERGQLARAQQLAQPIGKLTAALFQETNPVPLKYALSLFGLMSPKVRLPLVELTAEAQSRLAPLIARMLDRYPDDMIGTLCGAAPEHRRVARA